MSHHRQERSSARGVTLSEKTKHDAAVLSTIREPADACLNECLNESRNDIAGRDSRFHIIQALVAITYLDQEAQAA
jgi:hypothetical protein